MLCAQLVSSPCERTLWDYTKPAPGLQFEVLIQMKDESKVDLLPESKRYVSIAMKIKEDIIYEKHTGSMIGFVNLGLSIISYYRSRKKH